MKYYATFDNEGFIVSLTQTPPQDTNINYYEIDESFTRKHIILENDVVREMTEEEIDARQQKSTLIARSSLVRVERDRLLNESDKFVGADRWTKYTTTQKGNITAYRQALRDLPLQEGFPEQVVFPELKL